MKKSRLTVFILMVTLSVSVSNAALTSYYNDEAGFFSALNSNGLSSETYDFENLNVDDIISDQYNPPVSFSTSAGNTILAKPDAHASWALDENGISDPIGNSLCAEIQTSTEHLFEMSFDNPVRGASFWALDLYTYLDVSVFGESDVLLGTDNFPISGSPAYTFIGVLWDSSEITRIKIQASNSDPWGFDRVTVVPEPGTVLLFGLGGLALRRKCRAK